jgi:hypothetical protein
MDLQPFYFVFLFVISDIGCAENDRRSPNPCTHKSAVYDEQTVTRQISDLFCFDYFYICDT